MPRKQIFNCDLKNLAQIRDFIERELVEVVANPTIRAEIVLATDEACANSMIHGNQCCEERFIELSVEFSLSERKIAIKIIDTGETPELPHQCVLNLEENIRNHKKGGMGLYLMNQVMDQVIRIHDGNQNITILEKKIYTN